MPHLYHPLSGPLSFHNGSKSQSLEEFGARQRNPKPNTAFAQSVCRTSNQTGHMFKWRCRFAQHTAAHCTTRVAMELEGCTRGRVVRKEFRLWDVMVGTSIKTLFTRRRCTCPLLCSALPKLTIHVYLSYSASSCG